MAFVREGASPGVVVVSGEFEVLAKGVGISRRWYLSWETMRRCVFRCLSVVVGSLEVARAAGEPFAASDWLNGASVWKLSCSGDALKSPRQKNSKQKTMILTNYQLLGIELVI